MGGVAEALPALSRSGRTSANDDPGRRAVPQPGRRSALPQEVGPGQRTDVRHCALPRPCAVPAMDQHRCPGRPRHAQRDAAARSGSRRLVRRVVRRKRLLVYPVGGMSCRLCASSMRRIRIDEAVRPPNLARPLIHQSASRTISMLGLGAGFDFGNQNETYFNVSQGYRPVRFFDVASPFSNVSRSAPPPPSRCHGKPALRHAAARPVLRRESVLDRLQEPHRDDHHFSGRTVLQNSGDTRHRGFEAELSYDILARRHDSLHLTAFGNISLLDAKFTKSNLANRVGNKPDRSPQE